MLGVPAASTICAAPTTLAEALALWRARGSDSAQLTDALSADALAVPSWRGSAAQAYEQWLTRLAEACHRLCDHAERIHRALARPDPADVISGIGGAPPPPADGVAAITVAQAVQEPAAHNPASSHCHAPVPDPPATLFLPNHVWQHLASLTAAARDRQPECPPTTPPQPPDTSPDTSPDDGEACDEPPRGDRRDQQSGPGTHHEHDQGCDCERDGDRGGGANDINPDDDPPAGDADDCSADGGNRNDGNRNDGDSGDGRDNSGGDRCDDSPPDTDPAPEAPDSDPRTAPRGPGGDRDSPTEQDPAPQPTPTPSPLPTPLPTPTPSAPPIPSEPPQTGPGELPPPAHDGPVHPTSSRSDNTALLAAAGATAVAAATAAVFLARRDRARAPRTPDIADTAPIPPLAPELHGAPRPSDPQLAADHPAAAAATDDPTDSSPAAGQDGERSDQQLAPAAPGPSGARPWLYIGMLGEQPVLIDPAATHGLGLTGPGAAGVARSLASGLLDMDDGDVLVVAADTATALLEQPGDSPITPGQPPGDATHRPDGDESRLRVAPDPFTALQVLEAELAHRRATPAPPGGWPLCVLLAPAPTTTPAQHRLAAVLTAGRSFEIAAIVLGWWPTGWSCHIDEDHRVTQHTGVDDDAHSRSNQPDSASYDAPTAPAHIVGAQLIASTSAELRRALTRAAREQVDDGPDSRPQPPDPTPSAPDLSDPIAAASSEIREALDPGSRTERTSDHDARRQTDPSTDPSAPELDQPDPAPEHATERQPPAPAHPTAHPTGPRGAPALSGPGVVARPPLWLSILGSAVLRYTPQPDPAAPAPSQAGVPARTDVVIDRLGPRATELLVYLAVHPNGVRRDSLVAALWPEADRSRPTNALNAVLARLRKTLRATGHPDLPQVVTQAGGKYLLDSNLIGVDYWTFLIAAADITHPDPNHRAHACNTAIRTYQGHLAADLTSEWLITLREATRRRYFDALTALARLTIHHDPERTLGLLETARNLEPLKEGIYRDIMRIQAQLNRPDAADNTLALLRAQLADIDTEPEPETLQLAATIRHGANQHGAPNTESASTTHPTQPHQPP
jgi:DNA-binding SARP family transcriptional activator